MSSRHSLAFVSSLGLALALLTQCLGPEDAASSKDVSAGWDVVYRVLQHPRCVNCHPSGDVPFKGTRVARTRRT